MDDINEGNRMEINPSIKRCPQCHSLSLEFDAENNRMICKKCGFEQRFRSISILDKMRKLFLK